LLPAARCCASGTAYRGHDRNRYPEFPDRADITSGNISRQLHQFQYRIEKLLSDTGTAVAKLHVGMREAAGFRLLSACLPRRRFDTRANRLSASPCLRSRPAGPRLSRFQQDEDVFDPSPRLELRSDPGARILLPSDTVRIHHPFSINEGRHPAATAHPCILRPTPWTRQKRFGGYPLISSPKRVVGLLLPCLCLSLLTV